jgi:hypothetical protein
MVIIIKANHKDTEFDVREELWFDCEMMDILSKEHQKEFIYEKIWEVRNRVTNELIRLQKTKRVNS